MGLYDRDYIRDDSSPRRPSAPFGVGSSGWAVKYLIAVNVVVFLLQIFVVREATPAELFSQLPSKVREQILKSDPEFIARWNESDFKNPMAPIPGVQISVVTEWFKLDTDKVLREGQAWRLITHAFCHDRHKILHILVNLLVLYSFGIVMETMYGSREFLFFYFAAILAAAFAYIGLEVFLRRHGSAVGASGAVFAVTMLYTLHFPRNLINIFFVIPIETRWAMALFVLWDLHPIVLALQGEQVDTGVAHAAHLGGALFGYLYYRFHWNLSGLFGWVRGQAMRRLRPSRARPRLRIAPETVPDPDPPALDVSDDRLDEILAKISRSGQTSLTDEEHAILKKASEDLKNRRQKGEL